MLEEIFGGVILNYKSKKIPAIGGNSYIHCSFYIVHSSLIIPAPRESYFTKASSAAPTKNTPSMGMTP